MIQIINNNLQKNNNYSKTNIKNKANLATPSSNKLYNKISITQTGSKEKTNKMRVKKILPINVACNLNKLDKNQQRHKKNNKSLINTENINNTFNLAKPAIKLNKNIKINTASANYSTQNMRKTKHLKNKTFDYNTINDSNN